MTPDQDSLKTLARIIYEVVPMGGDTPRPDFARLGGVERKRWTRSAQLVLALGGTIMLGELVKTMASAGNDNLTAEQFFDTTGKTAAEVAGDRLADDVLVAAFGEPAEERPAALRLVPRFAEGEGAHG